MKIATVLNIHNNSKMVHDTIDSIQTYVTDDILAIVDGAHWNKVESVAFPCYKLEGFRHNCPKSPYRNVTLGLKEAANLWPDADWYCYTEYDCLFASNKFKNTLKLAENMGIWCLGNDHVVGDFKFPLLDLMLETKIEKSHYLLGCCVFHRGDFIRKLVEMDFFNRFLYLTNSFSQGFFPGYEEQGGYDIGEHLYPTLAAHYGGQVGHFARYSLATSQWYDNYKSYPLRWKPELDAETEHFPEAYILHPLKTYDHPIREYHRKKRNELRSS
jgi:hypothetical protein